MKNVNQIGKRFLALLIAVVMIVGQIPFGAVATEEPVAVPNEDLRLTLIRSVTEDGVDSTDEENNPVPGYDTFSYSVKLEKSTDGGATWEEVKPGSPITWSVSDQIPEGHTMSWNLINNTFNGKDPASTVVVRYNGRTLTASGDGNQGEGKTEVSWSAVSSWNTTEVVLGKVFDVAAPQVTGNSGLEGAEWVCTSSYVTDGKGVVTDPSLVGSDITVAKYELKNGENVLYTFEYKAKVVYPVLSDVTYTVNGAAANAWYQAAADVVVSVNAPEVTDAAYLPPMQVGETNYTAWTKNDDGIWSQTYKVEDQKQVTLGVLGYASCTVGVDSMVPVISDVSAYVYNGKTYVSFNYTHGLSGIATSTVNGHAVALPTDSSNAVVNAEIAEDLTGKDIVVSLTSHAGLTGTNTPVVAKDDLAIAAPVVAPIGIHNGKTYVADGTVVSYAINNGAGVAGTVEYTQAGNDSNTIATAVADTGASLTLTSGVAGTVMEVSGVKVSVKDNLNREKVYEDPAIYAVDLKAPVITMPEIADGYFNGVKSYTFTVADDYLVLSGAGSIALMYTLEGADNTVTPFVINGESWTANEDGTFSYTLTIQDGQKLTGVAVEATDNSGNTADASDACSVVVDTTKPVVSIMMSNNVTGISTGSKGEIFVNVPQTAASDIITMTVTVTDANLDAAYMESQGFVLGSAAWSKTWSMDVGYYETGSFDFAFDVIDLAGNKASETQLVQYPVEGSELGTVCVLTYDAENSNYAGTIRCDRRYPGGNDTEAPKIELKTEASTYVAANGYTMYKDAFSFEMLVHDLSAGGADSGLKKVSWTLEDNIAEAFLSTNAAPEIKAADALKEHTFTVDVNPGANINESNNVQLIVTVEDYAGNIYAYATPAFAFDNKAPEIKVVYGDEQPLNGNYYSVTRTAEISVYDLNLDHETVAYVLNGETVKFPGEGTDATVTVPCTEEGHYTLSVSATDLAKTSYTAAAEDYTGATPTDFHVDLNNPAFTVVKTVAEGSRYVQEDATTEYYNGQVLYTVSLVDTYLDEANVVYTITNSSNVPVTSEPVALKSGESMTIAVNNGEILTDIQLYALDLSGRYACEAADVKSDVPFVYDEETHIWTYDGLDVAVDTTPAAVTLKKDVTDGKWIQSYEDYDYYNAPLTYSIDIQDRFLTDLSKSSVKLVVEYMDPAKNITQTIGDFAKRVLDDAQVVYSTKFEVLDGEGMKNISIQVIDNAGNATAVIDVIEDAMMTTFAFDKETQTNAYLGSTAVVDTTTPKATLTIDGNVESFYTYKGVAYVKLADPAAGLSGILGGQKDETVSLTINVTDKNVTLDSENEFPVKNNTSNDATNWTGTEQKNADTTLTYFDQITVASDKTGYFKFDLTVYDLAGNAITDEDITVTAINGTVPNNLKEMVKTEEGKFGTVISVDRRRPSTVTGDNDAPVITIQPSIGFTTSNNDKELYAGAFNFALTVTDGTDDESNSGLNSIDWVIEDPVGFVAPANVVNGQEAGTYTQSFSIPVTLAEAAGESNSVKLTIVATDNVGNTTTYIKEFAVDTLAPRVTVSYDNNSVLNAKYFKADRIASIRVEDINFNPATTPITTEVPVSAWEQNGDVYTATCAYTADGEYTFDMSATDKAANVSEIDFTNGGRNAAPKEFTIDKTAPVINVAYNPASPIGTDPQGVQYYDTDLGVTVTITEVNFNAAEVQANMGDRNNLSFWSNNGDRHTSSTTYTEGNNYSFSIQYTDLAGNPATPYTSATFSVDTHAPTIVISNGDLTTENLNIVQGDLVLGFTINDEQNNLSGYTVKVTHLNNEFQETVVEGAEYYTVNDVNNRTTVYVNFDSIESIKENDGTYNVQITATDYAGHIVSLNPSLNFSLNRFGSTFMTDDEFTANFLEPSSDGNVYQNSVSNKLVIKEINPNKVWQDDSKTTEGSVITIAVNGQSIILEKDVDYTVTLTEEGTGSNKWYVYTYEIDPANFLDGEELVDGNYTVLLYGIDEAGNKNTNESNEYGSVQKDAEGEYSGKITFTLDHKAPVITIYGIETGDSIDAENKQLNINLSDNTPASVKVLVNGVEVVLSETMEGLANNQLWLAQNPETGEYVLNIPESNEKRNVTIVTTDAAGNVSEQVIEDVLITSNAFVRAINNPVIVGSVGVGTVGLIALIIFLLKKKKNKEEQPA